MTCAHVGCTVPADVVAVVEGRRQTLCFDHVHLAIRRQLSVETLWDEPLSTSTSRGPEHLAESGAPAAETAPRAEQAPAPSLSPTEPPMAQPANLSPEPHIRPDADAHPELCRVDGCDRGPLARGVCQQHYNQLGPSGGWRSKAVEILLPAKTGPARAGAPPRLNGGPKDEPISQVARLVGADPDAGDAEIVAAVKARLEADAGRVAATVEEQLRGVRERVAELEAALIRVTRDRAELLLRAETAEASAAELRALLEARTRTERPLLTPEDVEHAHAALRRLREAERLVISAQAELAELGVEVAS